MTDLPSVDITFDNPGTPFAPFNQLMGVLPAASAHALPEPYRPLFAADSPIADFYPTDFGVDMNGKRFAWQGVALLPFIDEARLLAATALLENCLPPDEAARNGRRDELLLMSTSHPLAAAVFAVADAAKERAAGGGGDEPERVINATETGGLGGTLLAPAGDPCPPVLPAPPGLGDDVAPNAVVVARYRAPLRGSPHACRPLEGQPFERAVVSESDLPPPKPLWHEDRRGGGPGGPRQYHYAHQHHNQGGWAGWGAPPPGGPWAGAQWGGPPPPGMRVHAQHGYAYGAGPPPPQWGGGGGGGGGYGGPPHFAPVGGGGGGHPPPPYAPAPVAGGWGAPPPPGWAAPAGQFGHGGGGGWGGGPGGPPPPQQQHPGWAAPPGQFGAAPQGGGGVNPYAALQREPPRRQ